MSRLLFNGLTDMSIVFFTLVDVYKCHHACVINEYNIIHFKGNAILLYKIVKGIR